jgi:acyl-CoA synthetase
MIDAAMLASDRARLRERWYQEGYYRRETLSEALRTAATQHPDTRFCFHSDAGVIETTTAEICAEGWLIAGALYSMGVRPGDVLAMQLPSWRETAVLYAAGIHAGATILPVVHTFGPAELDFILRQSGAKWLAVPDRWRGVDYLERCARSKAAEGLAGIVVVGENRPPRGVTWSDLRRLGTTEFPRPRQDADELCVLMYTSGTTADPKGVRHTHNTIRSEWEIPFLANSGPYLNPFPAGHIAGFNFMLRPMICGVPMVFLERWEPHTAAELVERYRVTQTGGTPYFLLTLLEAARRDGRDLSSIESYSLGATGVTPDHVRLTDTMGWSGGRSYGLTEHSTVTRTHPTMSFERRALTDGRVQPGTEIRVVDENGLDVVRGGEGEILTRGPELFAGYTDAALDLQAFIPGGWFRTGDIGRCDAEGYLTITDRKKDIIIRGGENISSREVEEVLERHAAVVEAAAVSMPDARLGEKVCIYVVARPGLEFTFETMAEHCRGAGLARHKTPERLVLVSELPRNPAGKVRKEQLRAVFRKSP